LLVTTAASTLAFALMAWVSSADSVQMLQDPTVTAAPPKLPGLTPVDQPGHISAGSGTPTPLRWNGFDLSWVDDLLMVLVLAVALIVVALMARWAWRERWRRLHRVPQIPFEVLPELAVALANDATAQLAVLQEGSPRNAIVACWLRLEEVAGEAGVPPDPAETSTEFTTRVLGALAFDPAMIHGFAGLYREARFSRHELGERSRRAAIAALRSLYSDISASSILIPDVSDEGFR